MSKLTVREVEDIVVDWTGGDGQDHDDEGVSEGFGGGACRVG